jgi:hypothetical protein
MSNNAEDPRVKELADLFNQLPDAKKQRVLLGDLARSQAGR